MESAPSEFEGRLAQGRDWREIVAWVGDLPPMPHVAAKAMVLVDKPETKAGDLTELLSSDTALAARVLKIANSAMFARQREISTISQAIMLIGFKSLKGIIVAATLKQMNRASSRINDAVWEHSMGVASAASLLAKKLKKKYVEEVFLLGLLHSLGQIVLISQKATTKDYEKIPKLIAGNNVDYVTAETETFGFAHPLIGALVAKKWNFSTETCQIILHYKDPIDSGAPSTDMEEKIALIQGADALVHAAGIGTFPGYPEQSSLILTIMKYLGVPGSTPEDCAKLVEEIKNQFDADKGFLT